MDTSKLEKDFNRTLPFWYRVRNKIMDVMDFLDGIASLFEVAFAALLVILFGVLVGPFVLIYKVLAYYLKKKPV